MKALTLLLCLVLPQDQDPEIRKLMKDPAEKIDLSIPETDVQAVLRMFAEFTGLNLMIVPARSSGSRASLEAGVAPATGVVCPPPGESTVAPDSTSMPMPT